MVMFRWLLCLRGCEMRIIFVYVCQPVPSLWIAGKPQDWERFVLRLGSSFDEILWEKQFSWNYGLSWFGMSEEQYMFLKFSEMELDQLSKSSKDVSTTNFEFWRLILFDTNPIHSLSLQTEGKLLVHLYFLLNCGHVVFWVAVIVLLSLLLRNVSPVSKHDVLCGVATESYMENAHGRDWSYLATIAFEKTMEERTQVEERQPERSCLETHLSLQNSDFSMSDLSHPQMMMPNCSKVMSYQKDITVLSGTLGWWYDSSVLQGISAPASSL